MKTVSYAHGEIIFNQGDVSNQIYKIASGTVDIIKDYGRVHPLLLLTKEAGKFFGEVAGLLGTPRTATAIAASDCTVLLYEPEELTEKGSENFEFMDAVYVMLIQECQDIANQYLDINLPSLLEAKEGKDARKAAFEQNPDELTGLMKMELHTHKKYYRLLCASMQQHGEGKFERASKAYTEAK